MIKLANIAYDVLRESLKLNQKGIFYHKSPLKNLDSFKSEGIDPKRVGSFYAESQGGGFYCFSDFEASKKWSSDSMGTKLGIPNPLSALKDGFVIIQFEAVLNSENFEIDYELGFNSDYNKKMKASTYLMIIFNTVYKYCKDNNYLLYRYSYDDNMDIDELEQVTDSFNVNWGQLFVASKGTLKPDDIELTGEITAPYPSNKDLLFFWTAPPGGGDQTFEHQSMKSLDSVGLKDVIKDQVLDKCVAFKYVGPKTKPTKYITGKGNELGSWVSIKQ